MTASSSAICIPHSAFRAAVLLRERTPHLHATWREREVKRAAICLCGQAKMPGKYLCLGCLRTCPPHLLYTAGKDRSVRRRCVDLILDHADRRGRNQASREATELQPLRVTDQRSKNAARQGSVLAAAPDV